MSERTDPADPRPAAAFDAPPPRLRSAVGGLTSNQAGLALVTILFVLLFNGLTPGFGSPFNLYALGRVVAIDVVIGFSMMVVLATGGMNLAVGSIGVCAAMAAGWAMQQAGLPIPIAVLAGIAMGAALGTVNGLGIRADRGQQLHHHARDHEPLLRRDDPDDRGGGVPLAAAGLRRPGQDPRVRLRLGSGVRSRWRWRPGCSGSTASRDSAGRCWRSAPTWRPRASPASVSSACW